MTPEEKKFRQRVLNLAKTMGRDVEVKAIFKKYDLALKNCTNPLEYQQMATMGLAEIHKIMDCYGALVVNGQEIIPADPGGEMPKEDERFVTIKG